MKRTNTTATLNRNDVDAIFTSKVTSLLDKGYTIHPSTMSGSGHEIAKVDLRKGDDLLRVWMETDSDFYASVDTMHIRIGRCNEKRCLNHGFGGMCSGFTVWNEHLEVLEDTELAVIDSNKGIFASPEDGKRIAKLRLDRLMVRDRSTVRDTEVRNEKAKAIALKFIQRQPRMKTAKVTDIEHIQRIANYDGSFGGYRIYAKAKSFTLKPAKA